MVDGGAGRRGALPRLLGGRGRLRREHDDAQLRALAHARPRARSAGDEIVVTRLDHDAQRLALARARARPRACACASRRSDDDMHARPRRTSSRCSRSGRASSRSRGPRTRSGRSVDVARGRRRSRTTAGALAWVDAVHYAPHGPIDVAAAGADVLLCSPYKFFGPHLGLAFVRRELLERWRPYKVRPAPDEPAGRGFETGTLPHELLAGLRRRGRVRRVGRLGARSPRTSASSASASSPGLPDSVPRCTACPTMDGRVPTFAVTSGA